MDFKLNIKTTSNDTSVKDKCLAAVEEVLEKEGGLFGLDYDEQKDIEIDDRPNKLVMEGVMNFSFGKNGIGLTNELIKIGELVNMLSKDNYVYIEDSFVDACDDVYDLKFHITPHEENKWMIKKDKEEEN